MATSIYNTLDIELQDGSKATLKPLPIKQLRLFMKEVEKLQQVKKEDEAIDIFIDACAIALSKSLPELTANKEALEEALDVPTIWKIFEICGGIQMGDPNLTVAASLMSGEN